MLASELAPGTLVHGRYRVVRPIGKGGMGAVYEAIDERLDHRVALKQTLAEGDEAARAFEREAKLLASLRHAALPVVSDFFGDENGRFLVMQFIPGKTLADLVRERGGALPVANVLRWADDLLRALEYLHGHKPPILHRDIKPANLKATGESDVVLLDFGLAKGSTEVTGAASSIYGLTPQYAPLEQFQGSGTDATSDLFALGGTLYFLLTLQPPVDALTRASALAAGKPDPLKPAREANTEVPPRVDAWITKALAVHREDRHSSAAAMRGELAEIRTGITEKDPPVGAPSVTVTQAPVRAVATVRASAPRARPRARVIAVGVAFVALAGAGAWWALRATRATSGSAWLEFKSAKEAGLEFRWPGNDLWDVFADEKRVDSFAGTKAVAVTPGRYRVSPRSQPLFEPIEFTVRQGQQTIVNPAVGSFEFQWPAGTLWDFYRGETLVGYESGTAARFVAPGKYRIAPRLAPLFEPIEFTVSNGQKTVLKPPAGSFEFTWPAGDLWDFYRGETLIGFQNGPTARFVAPGNYRVAPKFAAVFEPIGFSVVEGQKTVLDAPSGTFEFQWKGDDLWDLYRGETLIDYSGGAKTRAVMPGKYRIAPKFSPVFEPIEFTVAAGQRTSVKRPSGSFEFQWKGDELWDVYRGETLIASDTGAKTRVVMAGTYRIAPRNKPVFRPVTFTVREDQKTIVKPN